MQGTREGRFSRGAFILGKMIDFKSDGLSAEKTLEQRPERVKE